MKEYISPFAQVIALSVGNQYTVSNTDGAATGDQEIEGGDGFFG